MFVNTGAVPIGVYELSVSLPEDRRVQKVVEQSPRPKRSEVLPRVRLDRFGEQQGATLQLAAMKQGDRTAMTLNVVPARPSYGWLLVGLLQLAVMLTLFKALERWRPVEPVTDRAAVRVDVVYTLIHRLGLVRVVLFLALDPLWNDLAAQARLAGLPAWSLDSLWPGVTDVGWVSFLLYLLLSGRLKAASGAARGGNERAGHCRHR